MLGLGDQADSRRSGCRRARGSPRRRAPGSPGRAGSAAPASCRRTEQSTRSTPSVAELRGERDGVLERPAALDPVAGGDAHDQRELGRPGGADRLDDLEQQPRAPGEVAAVGVAALVRERREELVQQVAVRGVELDAREAGRVRAPGGRGERRRRRRRSRRRRARAARASRRRRARRSARPAASRRSSGASGLLPRTHGALTPTPCGRRARAGCPARRPVLAQERGDARGRPRPARPSRSRSRRGLMRPSGTTAGRLDDHQRRRRRGARAPRWTRCQSFGTPSIDGVLAHGGDPGAIAELDVPEGDGCVKQGRDGLRSDRDCRLRLCNAAGRAGIPGTSA